MTLSVFYEPEQKTFFDTFNKKIEQKKSSEPQNLSALPSSKTISPSPKTLSPSTKNITSSPIITIDDDESSSIPQPPKKLAKSSKVCNWPLRNSHDVIILVFTPFKASKIYQACNSWPDKWAETSSTQITWPFTCQAKSWDGWHRGETSKEGSKKTTERKRE